ncbi:hypothetical protein EDB86DRAFT_3111700 [Lactarius hatsudake]|nr:hypothetical protein EDB86DRAFT_3111700 [Lactarius hatsudake]
MPPSLNVLFAHPLLRTVSVDIHWPDHCDPHCPCLHCRLHREWISQNARPGIFEEGDPAIVAEREAEQERERERESSSVCASRPVERAIASNVETTTTPDELSSSPQLSDLPPSFSLTVSESHTFFLFITTTALVTKAWFHCVAAAFGDPAPAQTVAGLMLPMLVLYTGYTIPGPSMVEVDLVHQPDPVRLRGAYVQRVSYTQRNMLKTHSEWYQICKRVSHEPGGGLSAQSPPNDIWQSFGIIIGFGIAFVTAFLFFVEYNTSVSGETSATLFKRGAKAPVMREAQGKADTVDEEKGVPESRDTMEKIRGESGLYSMDVAVPMMLDVFTWSTMFEWESTFQIQQRKFAHIFSPQITVLNVLAERQTAGVVGGERLANGYPLPSDFQAQT